MADQWRWSAEIAILLGVGLFAVIFIPVLAWQYRRYGRLSFRRTLGAAALAIYGVAIVSYTLLPLPDGNLEAWCAAHGVDGAETTLFHSLTDIREQTAGLSLMQTARSMVVLQVVFNVVLFIPWGVLVRRFLGWGIIPTVASAFVTSVLIESTQYTGIWGAIPCSYRVADVDDIATNTLGGLIGALIAPVVLAWMPRGKDLHRDRSRPRPVTMWRRWFAMLLDALLLYVIAGVVAIGYRMVQLLTSDSAEPLDGAELGQAPELWLSSLTALVIVVVLPPLIGSGASIGQRVVWLRPVRDDLQPPRWRLIVRTWVLLGVFAIGHVAQATEDSSFTLPTGLTSLLGITVPLVIAVAVLSVPFTRGYRGASCLFSGLDLVDARTLAPTDDEEVSR